MLTIFASLPFPFKIVAAFMFECMLAYVWYVKARVSYFYRASQAKNAIPEKIFEIIFFIALIVLFTIFFTPLSGKISLLQSIVNGTIFQMNSSAIIGTVIGQGFVYLLFLWIIICDMLIIFRSSRLLKLLQEEE